jgi:hypothetical protein
LINFGGGGGSLSAEPEADDGVVGIGFGCRSGGLYADETSLVGETGRSESRPTKEEEEESCSLVAVASFAADIDEMALVDCEVVMGCGTVVVVVAAALVLIPGSRSIRNSFGGA